MAVVIKGGEKGLPLFEYAKQFENFDHYEDLDDFFIHCLETNGFEVAERLRVSTRWVYGRVKCNLIPHTKLSRGAIRFSEKKIEEWLRNREAGSVRV